MLVLSRKIGETIIIGDTVRVTIVDIGQGRVKIGVQAPDNISIDREEIHEKKAVDRELHLVDLEAAVPVTIHNRLKNVDAAGITPAPAAFRRKPR